MAEGLTTSQREFVRRLAAGSTQAAAYRAAYPCQGMGEDAVYAAASRLVRNVKVCAELGRLCAAADDAAIATRRARMQWLSARVQEWQPGEDIRPVLACIQELNRMDGAYDCPPAPPPAPPAVLSAEALAEIERQAHLL